MAVASLAPASGLTEPGLQAGWRFHRSDGRSAASGGRDRFGRFFNYPSPDWLEQAYGPGRWRSPATARRMARWLA